MRRFNQLRWAACLVVSVAAFGMAGTEMIGLTGSRSADACSVRAALACSIPENCNLCNDGGGIFPCGLYKVALLQPMACMPVPAPGWGKTQCDDSGNCLESERVDCTYIYTCTTTTECAPGSAYNKCVPNQLWLVLKACPAILSGNDCYVGIG